MTLEGVLDLHLHCGPDSLPRIYDVFEVARIAKERGMRGFVAKNHFEPTASLAYCARQVVPGIEVYGGVTLNLTVGGINPAAVDYMARVTGGYGRFVWMGSFDTEAQIRHFQQDRPYASIARNGLLLPEVIEVISVIARHQLILSTGHNTPEEVLLMIREARRQGVQQIIVTHAMIAPIHMSTAVMKQAAEMGAWVEFVYNGLIGPHKEFEMTDYAQAIQQVGAEHCILTTDLGQVVNPPHADGMLAFMEGMASLGFSRAAIDRMTKENPARVMGLL
jgi:hypothetical protein